MDDLNGQSEKKTFAGFDSWLIRIAVIFIVVCLGLFVVNQFLSYYYKSQFLQAPCKLCSDLNPGVENCIKELNKKTSYPDGQGGWTDPDNPLKINIST